ncbi:MAG: hypothetical protein Ct9H300mP28_04950 [Pseudomonadota bacterium]|nr:MAG: hypothetical protein Ct9H300mP28_04950 [Pseudomonadota bacterium]
MGTDFIILSGGTSKRGGDLNYRVFEKFSNPGILVHGVSLKPGKPLCPGVLEGESQQQYCRVSLPQPHSLSVNLLIRF